MHTDYKQRMIIQVTSTELDYITDSGLVKWNVFSERPHR